MKNEEQLEEGDGNCEQLTGPPRISRGRAAARAWLKYLLWRTADVDEQRKELYRMAAHA